mmetsp:Transcript_20982/g.65608  ORF Transcript_20982/g.65608 Transcript_20982/m.65608 type:complete len:335 (+) Transcript_20982:80-1084(+)
MDCTHVELIIASFVASTISEVAFAAVGFGPAILYQVSWQLLAILGISGGGLAEAVGNIIMVETPTGMTQLLLLRRHFKWRFALLYNLPYAVMCPLGSLALVRYGQSLWMKRLLGVLLLCVAASQLLQRMRRQASLPSARPSIDAEPRSWSTTAAVALASSASGLLRGLFGVAGPPFMVLLMHFPVDRDKFRCVAACQRVTVVFVQGCVLGLSSDITPACWRMYCTLMAGGVLGLTLGNTIASRVDKEAFQRWMLLFLSSGSLLMLCTGAKVPSMVASVLVGLAVLATLVCPMVVAARRKLAQRDAQRTALVVESPALGESAALEMRDPGGEEQG